MPIVQPDLTALSVFENPVYESAFHVDSFAVHRRRSLLLLTLLGCAGLFLVGRDLAAQGTSITTGLWIRIVTVAIVLTTVVLIARARSAGQVRFWGSTATGALAAAVLLIFLRQDDVLPLHYAIEVLLMLAAGLVGTGRFSHQALAISLVGAVSLASAIREDDRITMTTSIIVVGAALSVALSVAWLLNREERRNWWVARAASALSGIVPICADCRRIRTAPSDWIPIEAYITESTHASFSHTYCPECADHLLAQGSTLDP